MATENVGNISRRGACTTGSLVLTRTMVPPTLMWSRGGGGGGGGGGGT